MSLFARALRALRTAKHLKKVLELVLQIGNFMNHGSRSGNVDAFDIEALKTLAETKCSDLSQKTTLLDFLQLELTRIYPQALEVTSELAILETAKKGSWDKIDLGVKEMKVSCSNALKSAATIKITLPGDNFQKILDKVAVCAKEFGETDMVWEDVQKDWKQVALLYGKDADKMKPEIFFGTINAFLTAFQASRDAIEKKKADEIADKEKSAAANSKRQELDAKRAALDAKKAAMAAKTPRIDISLSTSLEDSLSAAAAATASTPRSNQTTPTPRNRSGSGGKGGLQRNSSRRPDGPGAGSPRT